MKALWWITKLKPPTLLSTSTVDISVLGSDIELTSSTNVRKLFILLISHTLGAPKASQDTTEFGIQKVPFFL